MRTMLFLAAALAAASSSPAAFAEGNGIAAPAAALDLGVDVSGVTRTVAGVRDYLASLTPGVRNAVLEACDAYSYTLDPKTPNDRRTLAFCGIALGG
jgi:hypothetical protein